MHDQPSLCTTCQNILSDGRKPLCSYGRMLLAIARTVSTFIFTLMFLQILLHLSQAAGQAAKCLGWLVAWNREKAGLLVVTQSTHVRKAWGRNQYNINHKLPASPCASFPPPQQQKTSPRDRHSMLFWLPLKLSMPETPRKTAFQSISSPYGNASVPATRNTGRDPPPRSRR